MENFCDTKFWDSNITWDSGVLEFTECFQQTVLVWIPCLFLWIFSLFDFHNIKTSKYKDIPWNFLNILKITFIVPLIILTTLDLILVIVFKDLMFVEIASPIVKLISFSLAGIIIYLEVKNGVRSSVVLFLFWLCFAISAIPQVRNEIQKYRGFESLAEFTIENYQFISCLIFYCFLVTQLALSSFADSCPRHSDYPKKDSEYPNPSLAAGVVSSLFFFWINKLIWTGYRKPLEAKDIFDLRPELESPIVFPKFEKSLDGKPKKQNFQKLKKVRTALLKAFGGKFVLAGFLSLIYHIIEIFAAFVLRWIIQFVSAKDELWKGIFYAIIFFLISFLMAIFEGQNLYLCIISGLESRTALLNTIYRKALKISNAFRKNHTTGEIVNLMAVDSQRFLEIPLYLHNLWQTPLIIAIVIYLLWDILGVATAAGLIVIIVMIPLSAFFAAKLKTLQSKQMVIKDQRIKIINEILNGMKVLKFYAWEPSFEEYVKNIREKEVQLLKAAALYNAVAFLVWMMTPFFVSLASFAVYVLIDENNILDAETAFVSIALFNILRTPLILFAMVIQFTLQAWISANRIDEFLNSEEINTESINHDKSGNAVEIGQASFSWEGGSAILNDIDFKVKKGSLVAIVGPVGCGKSSLISAVLGEMNKLRGYANTDGSIAYVPQQAWIQNCSLQQNITFGQQLEKVRYNRVIEACALIPDLKILPGGDQIEIGEKGINLSGGQKQRISLARAVYSDADIYLLDDPLSAVDSHVGKHIFENVLSENGVLAGKTRILVTHAISFLPFVDEIFVVSNGKITEQGSYKDLVDKQGDFSKFLEEYLKTDNSEEKEDEEDKNEVKKPRTSKLEFSKDNEETQLIKEEEALTGGVKLKIYIRYAQTAGILLSIGMILFNILYQVFSMLSSFWLSDWSENPDTKQPEVRDHYLLVFGLFGVGQTISMLLASLAVSYGTIASSRNLHNSLMNNILRLPMQFFDTNPLGRILNRFSRDIDVLDNFLPFSIRVILMMLFVTIAIFLIISISTPIFIAFIIPVSILYYFIQKFYISSSRQLKRLESIWRSPIYSFFSETLTGLSVIRATKEENRFIHESNKKIDENQKYVFPYYGNIRWLGVQLQTVGAVIIFAASIFAVIGKDYISPSLVALSLTYALQVSHSLRVLVRFTSEVETNIVAVERIDEYSVIPQEAQWVKRENEVDPKWPEKGEIEFKDFQFRYREGLDLALRGISFSVKSQEKIGIVGRTGAGKSSLTLALFRIVEPAGGSIVIDGVDISELGLHTLRSRLTIIPQDPVLFSGTLRLNLDPFQSYSDEAIWMALEHSHLKVFVRELPDALEYQVTEGGENLSVGQRQLVCLARALLRKTKILILDEATAAIDLETDELIQQTIRTQFADCTILTIAHRLNTIMDSDRVLVLDKGQVVEFDSPENLLNDENSHFYSMAKQAGLVKGYNQITKL